MTLKAKRRSKKIRNIKSTKARERLNALRKTAISSFMDKNGDIPKGSYPLRNGGHVTVWREEIKRDPEGKEFPVYMCTAFRDNKVVPFDLDKNLLIVSRDPEAVLMNEAENALSLT